MNKDLLRAAFAEGFTLARRDATSEETDDELIEDWWSTSSTRERALSSPATPQLDFTPVDWQNIEMSIESECGKEYGGELVRKLQALRAASPATPVLEQLVANWRFWQASDERFAAESEVHKFRGVALKQCADELQLALADVARLPASQESPLCSFWTTDGPQCGRCYRCRH